MQHFVSPVQFAHCLTTGKVLVVDVRPRPNARPVVPGRYWHISRNALVRMGRIAQGSREKLLVVDSATKAPNDVAVLRKAGLTDFAVLKGGAANYRTVMRMGTY